MVLGMNHTTSDDVLPTSCRRTHFAQMALPELQDAESFHGLRCAATVQHQIVLIIARSGWTRLRVSAT